jgi:hypothetical protein
MRSVLLVLTIASGLLLAGFLYQQFIVEGSLGPSAFIGVAVLGMAFVVLVIMCLLARTRFKEIIGKALLAGTSVVLSYGVVDVVAGWALIRPLSPPLVRDAIRHHRLVPNSFSEFRQRDFAYVQRVNNLGMRGRDVVVEKPANTVRVLMLGDSFTMGKGVEDHETFSVLVEQILRQATAACRGPEVEVLNGGVDSYAPILSHLQLKSDLRSLDPDVVVVNLDNSDLIQEAVYRQQATFGSDGEPLAVPATGQDSAYERLRGWTERHLFFTRLLLSRANRALNYGGISVRQVVNELGREHFAHTLEGDVDRTEQWRNIFDSLRRIRGVASEEGADFLLTTYPWGHQCSDKEWVPGRYAFMKEGETVTDVSARTIRRLAAIENIDVFEATPAFQAYRGDQKLYFDYDPHWTRAGHQVMATALAMYLADRYIAQWCAAR